MSATATPSQPTVIHYPDDDGLPMSDNTRQFNWIVLLHANLDAQFRNDPNVFVAGNHLIYPVEGNAKTRQAPDVYVSFSRPKQDRGSYKVWEEGGVFPQVVFEVWSPNNRFEQMQDKFAFYEKYGAEEYYIIYPEFPSHAAGWKREGEKLVRISEMNGHVSPRLGLRFALETGALTVYGPDNHPLRTPAEMTAEREEAERRAAEEAARAAREKERAAAERERADKLAAKLRELGVDPDAM